MPEPFPFETLDDFLANLDGDATSAEPTTWGRSIGATS